MFKHGSYNMTATRQLSIEAAALKQGQLTVENVMSHLLKLTVSELNVFLKHVCKFYSQKADLHSVWQIYFTCRGISFN